MSTLDNLPSTYEPRRFESTSAPSGSRAATSTPTPTARPHPRSRTPSSSRRPMSRRPHGGHALNNTLQDILIPLAPHAGLQLAWMPGTDHAGIATQAVVERTIFEKEGRNRHDLGREEMVRRIWEWKESYGKPHHQPAQADGARATGSAPASRWTKSGPALSATRSSSCSRTA